MALTVRTNGSGGSNIIQASWFNDYHDLLTGVMNDQYINITQGLTLKQITFTPPTAPTLSLVSGSGLGTGSYTYGIAYTNDSATSKAGTTAIITTTSGNNQVSLTNIPTGPAGVVGRVIYRSKVGTSSPLFKVANISDNVTTTFTDTVPDGSLAGPSPLHDFLGGSLIIKDQNSNFKAQIYNDGAVWFDAGSIISDGSGNFTATSLNAGSGGITDSGSLHVNGTSSLDNGAITTNGSGAATFAGVTSSGVLNLGFPSIQTLTNNAAIVMPSGSIKPITMTSSVTGITIPNGVNPGDVLIIVNMAGTGVTVTFSGSNIRLATNLVITAGSLGVLVWTSAGNWTWNI